jgi:hypothetical protein
MTEFTGGVDLPALHRAVVQRRAGRKWQLPNGVHYSVHGSGCYIRGNDGAVIDVDIAPDGKTLIFDVRRIAWFAQSIRAHEPEVAKLERAVRELVDERVLDAVSTVTGPGWYTTASSSGRFGSDTSRNDEIS